MKTKLLLASLFLSSLSTAPLLAGTPAVSADSYKFSVDKRPVDGLYELITVEKDELGTYTASHRVITPGFGSPVTDTTTELGQGLDCVAKKKGRKLASLFCAVDLRPADGALVEIEITRNAEGLFDATLHRATYSTLFSPATDETIELANGLRYIR